VEGDIEAGFDRIDHAALMDRVRGRIEDKRVLRLVKAFPRPASSSSTATSRDR
jgi:RNA-directed DNA polymerase